MSRAVRNVNSDYKSPQKENQYSLSERKIGCAGLIFSLIVIALKLYANNRDYLHNLFVQEKLVKYNFITDDGQEMFKNVWSHTVRFSNIWLPLLCGGIATYFTWIMVYLDSNIPGVQPPSPLSPKRYQQVSGHKFHLNYVFAFVIGILVAAYMYTNNIKLEY